MIYCLKCGSEIPDYGNFCPECGTFVDNELGALNSEDNHIFSTENHYKNDEVLEFSGSTLCVEKFNLSPAEFLTLVYQPKHLDHFFKPPYRITLFYFILKDILKLEIRSSNLILFNLDHVHVKKGFNFEKHIFAPFKPYESLMLDAFRSGKSFLVDTYEKGPLSYKFEKKTFKKSFQEELLNRNLFKYDKRSIASLSKNINFGEKKYTLTDHGKTVRESILSELGYDLEKTITELDTPHDYFHVLSFFGLDEGTMEEQASKIKTLDRKLMAVERTYERSRGGYSV